MLCDIDVVGVADEETLQMMNTPRCGNNDVIVTRNKRFVYTGHKWQKNILTWDIITYTDDLPRHIVDRQAKKAFQVGYLYFCWVSVSVLYIEVLQGDIFRPRQASNNHFHQNSVQFPQWRTHWCFVYALV